MAKAVSQNYRFYSVFTNVDTCGGLDFEKIAEKFSLGLRWVNKN